MKKNLIKPITFIPIYNCKKQILRLIDKFSSLDKQILKMYGCLVFVDNKSTDGTLDACKNKLQKRNLNYVIIENEQNYGFGGSHKVAFNLFLKSDFTHLFIFHGDDQGDLYDISKFYEVLTQNISLECILGSRFMKESKTDGYSKFRIIGNILFNILFSISVNKSIKDMGAGFNCFSRKFSEKKLYKECDNDLTFNYYLTSHIFLNIETTKIKFVPINWYEKDQISNVKLISQSFNLFSIILKTFFLRKTFVQHCAKKNFFNKQKSSMVFAKNKKLERLKI